MKTQIATSMKALGVVIIGLSLMGNQGCEQQPAAEGPRMLKWYADAGAIKSPPVQFGEAGSFDFGFVASEQLHGVLYNSGGFTTSANDFGIVQGSQGPELNGAQKLYMKSFGKLAVSDKLYYSDEARCLITLPDVKVAGSVNSFEMTSGNNISFGFNQQTGVSHPGWGIGVDMKVKVKDLSIQMMGLSIAKDLNNPTKYKVVAAPLVHEKSKETEGQIKLDYSGIGLGYGWYKNTPLSTITERALTQGVNKIKEEMNKGKWATKILDLQPLDEETSPFGDVGFIIKGGKDVNLRQGDIVEFYEDQTLWKGKACESDFYGYIRKNPKPVAEGEIAHLDDNFSTVIITKRFDNRDIKPGWRVQLLKRVEDAEAEKKKQSAPKK